MALLATAPAMLATFKVTNQWAVGAAAGGAAVLVAVAAVWQERYKRAAQQRDEQTLKIESGCLVLPNGQLPTVAQAADPLRLGVHPAPIMAVDPTQRTTAATAERVPVYVPRDIDADLREQLARGGFVLLVGDSTAGKSRAAYEAMHATLPDHLLIAPQDRAALPAALAQAASTRRCVLWLSDLEHYVGADGLTRTGIARVLGGTGHHRVILATLRAAEQTRLTSGPTTQDEAGRVAHHEVREALEQAHLLRVQRMFSAAEQQRARAREWDPRIADALAHADAYGLAEYLAAGPDLLRDWQDAWSPNTDPATPTHPRAAALIAAAVDIRRAGHTAPLPRSLLEATHEHYLTQRGGRRLHPEPLPTAWEWATKPRRATTALLQPEDDEHVQVFDYLTDTIQRHSAPGDHVPADVIQTVLADCAPRDAADIATTAYAQGRYQLAEIGLRAALEARDTTLGPEHPDTLTSRSDLVDVLWALGRFEEAEAENRAVLNTQTRVLGPEHPNTLTSRSNLACVLWALGRLVEAEAENRAVLNVRTRVLGPEHPDTLTSRNNLAGVLWALGRFEEAEAENRAVLNVRTRVLGPEHPDTLTSRNNLALVLADLGRFEEAEAENRAVLNVRTRVLGPEHPDTLTGRSNLALVLANLGRVEEAEAENRAVLNVRTRVLGPEHPDTLTSRNNLALVLRALGRFEEAEAENRAALNVCTRVLGPEHPNTLTSRNNLALVLADLGRLEEAEAENRAALNVCTRVLGPEHPNTLTSRNNLANVLGDLGRPNDL
ncbi:tetratricopeptide repeat protein [Streptomyces sp. NPDC088810]|uniref:tetratricopeptide repeat protein n=1 Tax=Streptomyces sp. NPDC088810 TaxID=3365904 RepID=UPI00382C3182